VIDVAAIVESVPILGERTTISEQMPDEKICSMVGGGKESDWGGSRVLFKVT